jgi:adenine-specific DNA-methyltransferase
MLEKLKPTFSPQQDLVEQLKQLIPEAVADGKINWETLKEVLGEHLEEEGVEHFGLNWPGKRQARRLASMPSKGTLVPVPGEGIDEENTGNIFIEGDNLEVLKILQKSYAGLVKMIYIDPPYNTGNDFIYKDDYREPLEDYLRKTGQIDNDGNLFTSNPKLGGRFHSNWLNMMYPRLRLARNLLRDDGVIFISLDENEIANLRLLMNDIFGEENFISTICVVSNWKGRSDDNYIATAHEYLMMYRGNQFKTLGLPLPDIYLKDYPEKDEYGNPYRLLGLRKRGSESLRQDRPGMFYAFYVNPENGSVSLTKNSIHHLEVFPFLSDGKEGRWRWAKETSGQRINELFSRKISGTNRWDIFQIDYAYKDGELRRIRPKSVWTDKNLSGEAGTLEYKSLMPDIVFNNPKSPSLIKQCLIQSTLEKDVILDFFAGSSSTAQAVFEQNIEDGYQRKFILVQLPEKIEHKQFENITDISKERIRRTVRKLKNQHQNNPNLTHIRQQDIGFKVYKLNKSNIKIWRDHEDNNIQTFQTSLLDFENPLIDEWKEADVVTEIHLLEGFPLDSQVEVTSNFSANRVYKVSSEYIVHQLFICLDDNVKSQTIGQVKSLASENVFICLDSALTDEAKLELTDGCNVKTI